jgi:NAD(P)-dependent dehydrogenase (short-subunit alcohol dehydrogenase family)
MAFPVRNKTALVTGGGSGICLAFTKLLVLHNCNVLIADLKLTPEAEELIGVKDGDSGTGKVVFKETDVTDWKQIQAAFDSALEEFGSLDIVCPGAGIFDPVCKLSLSILPSHLRSLTSFAALVKFLVLQKHWQYNRNQLIRNN